MLTLSNHAPHVLDQDGTPVVIYGIYFIQASYYAWFCPLVILMEYIMNKTMLLSQDSCISRRIFLIKKAELASAVHKMNRTISLEMPRFYCLH